MATIKIDLDTDILPIVDVGMYETILSIDNMFDETDSVVYEASNISKNDKIYYEAHCNTNIEKYKNIITEYALNCIKDFFNVHMNKEGWDVKVLDKAWIWSPQYYNYNSDRLEFSIEIDDKEFAKLCDTALGDKKFLKWAYEQYKSYDGFMCLFPQTKDEFIQSICKKDYYKIVSAWFSYLGGYFIGKYGYIYDICEDIGCNYSYYDFLEDDKSKQIWLDAYDGRIK